MSSPVRHGSIDRVVVDLNTQFDFLLPSGALPVTDRADILPRISKLMNWARLEQVPIISSLQANRPNGSSMGLPPHCVDRTPGQRKLSFTLMPNRLLIQGDNTLDVPLEPFRHCQQLILTKREIDFLSNPKADRLINAVKPKYWIVFGVTTSKCVKAMVLGLMARLHLVLVVKDACGDWSVADGEHALRQMDAKGALLATTEEVINGTADKKMEKRRPIPFLDEEEEDLVQLNYKPKPQAADEPIAAEASSPTDGRNLTKAGGNGPNGKNGKQGADGKRSPDLTEFIPPHLLRQKPRTSRTRSKSRRDLA